MIRTIENSLILCMLWIFHAYSDILFILKQTDTDRWYPLPQDTRLDVWGCIYPSKTVRFQYTSDFDEGGVMYFLGTNGRTKKYENPCRAGQVRSPRRVQGFALLSRFRDCEPACAVGAFRFLHRQASLSGSL